MKYLVLVLLVLVGCAQTDNHSLSIQITNFHLLKNKLESITDDKIIGEIQETLFNYLPGGVEFKDTIFINFIEYSDRGSYANNDSIIIDLSDLDTIANSNIRNLIAHEVHHILYMKWLIKTIRISPQDNNQLVLSWWQYRLILEGIAQQINFVDYPESIRILYKNKDLLFELMNFWIENQRNILKSNNPKKEYANIQNYMWSEWSRNKLKEYLSDSDFFSPHRPTVEYYFGYHLYKTIKDKIGNKGLNKVISNPKYLLRTYNEAIEEKQLILPEDIVELWEINYKENTVTNKP